MNTTNLPLNSQISCEKLSSGHRRKGLQSTAAYLHISIRSSLNQTIFLFPVAYLVQICEIPKNNPEVFKLCSLFQLQLTLILLFKYDSNLECDIILLLKVIFSLATLFRISEPYSQKDSVKILYSLLSEFWYGIREQTVTRGKYEMSINCE